MKSGKTTKAIVFGFLQNSHTSQIEKIYADTFKLDEIAEVLDTQEQFSDTINH